MITTCKPIWVVVWQDSWSRRNTAQDDDYSPWRRWHFCRFSIILSFRVYSRPNHNETQVEWRFDKQTSNHLRGFALFFMETGESKEKGITVWCTVGGKIGKLASFPFVLAAQRQGKVLHHPDLGQLDLWAGKEWIGGTVVFVCVCGGY